jgi:RimJ/RimL family protein N-acetyltransferase
MINFYPVLENERVLLRPLQLEDVSLLWPVAAEKDLWKLTTAAINNEADLESYVMRAIQERDNGHSIPFFIFDKTRNKPAGSTRFGNLVSEHKRVEIGWTWIGKEFQETGLNKNMKFLMLQYAFEVMQMNRVELKTDELNIQSQSAMLSIGARQEGILRHHMITSDGRFRNSVYFSIISDEWPNVKELLLKKMKFIDRTENS